jgi:mannose-1-phosphate guanylyltransferase
VRRSIDGDRDLAHHRGVRHAVVLAGGSGTRLWPASRRALPKQLLPLGPGDEPLIVAAVRRGRAIAGERVVIVTADTQVDATHAVVPGVELIAEPMARNTAAAIGLAAATIAAIDPDATLIVLPADQHVADEAELTRLLEAAIAAAGDDAIGTVGISPTRAETGYGYLEVADRLAGAMPVVRFVEKPDRATAEQYLASGRFLWNAGIFVTSARGLLAELDARLPATSAAVRAIAAGGDAAALYAALPSISIDHGVMEHAARVVTVAAPASLGWDDVGSWAALPAIRGADANGNTLGGEAIVIDGRGNLVLSDDDTLIATVGLSDLVVVKSGNAIIVIRKDQAQDVRKIVDALSARGLARYL